jgi:hypothetical protein
VTTLGIVSEAGHPEPWIIAMDSLPTRAAPLDYGARWAIEPTFSDFKGCGFELEDSQLEHPDRLERLILVMALAIYRCVRMGRKEAEHRPTPLEKKPARQPTSTMGVSESSTEARCLGLHGACGT